MGGLFMRWHTIAAGALASMFNPGRYADEFETEPDNELHGSAMSTRTGA